MINVFLNWWENIFPPSKDGSSVKIHNGKIWLAKNVEDSVEEYIVYFTSYKYDHTVELMNFHTNREEALRFMNLWRKSVK